MNDGRNINPALGTLSGEGSHQKVSGESLQEVTAFRQPGYVQSDPTYYERPVIKKSVWSWTIPAYYYVGGASGGAMILGAAATLLNRDGLPGLVEHSRLIGAGGGIVSSALLIHDLGKPSRFLYMLRVFRPTSPMSVGSWILVLFSSAAGLSALAGLGPQSVRSMGDTTAVVAGILGLGLAGYTGVLVSHTSVPLWQRLHRLLPVLFLSSGVASAASLFDLLGRNRRERRAVAIFGTAGRLVELTVGELAERRLATVPEAVRPLHDGFSGAVWKAAKVFTAASLVLSLVPNASKRLRRVAGVFGTLGSIFTRFAVHYAGQRSATNPRATFHQQRSGEGAFPFTGQAAIAGPHGVRACEAKPER
ncbi:MAG: polysulfide reductase NrfD [Acidobacteriota bacterium]|nr:polysulfide reductase NrfD [Acidobacteriota bacterium]